MNKESIRIVGVMVLVAALFGSVVSGIYLGSQETLERNQRIRLQRAKVEVFSLGDTEKLSPEEITALVDRRVVTAETVVDPETGQEFEVLRAYADDERTQLQGIGFNFRGLGFWAPIEGILALKPDLSRTLDIVILQQQETPGLGGRIEETDFTNQFRYDPDKAGLDGLLVSPPAKAAKYIQISATPPPSDSPMRERHVDALSGATQTCMAMERILNEHLAQFQRAMAAQGKAERR